MNQLTFDSIYGILNGITVTSEDSISLLGQPVHTTHCMSPIEIPWKQYGVSAVFECSGRFTTLTQCEGHRAAGCERVIVATPSKDIPMVCKHVSESTAPIISIASPSTCCMAPLLQILSTLSPIDHVSFTVVHSITSQQQVMDQINPEETDLRVGRAAGLNIIPMRSSASQCLPLLLPWTEGHLSGHSVHVPSFNGCLAEIDVQFSTYQSREAVLSHLQDSVKYGGMKDVIGLTDEDLVSSDLLQCPTSCVVDQKLLSVCNNHLHLSCWFDNEWSYCSRAIEFAM